MNTQDAMEEAMKQAFGESVMAWPIFSKRREEERRVAVERDVAESDELGPDWLDRMMEEK